MRNLSRSTTHAAGFTLIEILVGLVLGLIAIIVMYQVFALFEGQRRTSTSGSDTQTTGLISLFAIERDARVAGYGLLYNKLFDDNGYAGQILCTRVNFFPARADGTTNDVLIPLRIEDGVGPNGSDRITIAYSTSPLAASPMVLAEPVISSSGMVSVKNAPARTDLSQSIAFSNGDVLLIGTPVPIPVPAPTPDIVPYATPYENLRPCARVQANTAIAIPNPDLTSNPAGVVVTRNGGALGIYNPPAGTNVFPIAGEHNPAQDPGYVTAASVPTVVVNMGQFRWNRYSILQTGGAGADRYDLVVEDRTAGTAPQSLGDNIVSMQAQYGITDPSNAACLIVSANVNCQTVMRWVDAKLVGVEDWGNPTPGMISRIKAVRIAVVARSALPERIGTGPGDYQGADTLLCTPAQKDDPAVNCMRAWLGDAANPSPTLVLGGIPNWTTYRYRIYETIIPLRNVIWGAL